MASRRPDADPEPRDLWRRRILLGQGLYYVLTGAWPLLHFDSFADAVGLPINAFQAHAFAALILVVGGCLIEAARRAPVGRHPVLLGASVAGAIALVEVVWLPRFGTFTALWLDLPVEVALTVTLAVLYPREPAR
jgi:hypothetical protein